MVGQSRRSSIWITGSPWTPHCTGGWRIFWSIWNLLFPPIPALIGRHGHHLPCSDRRQLGLFIASSRAVYSQRADCRHHLLPRRRPHRPTHILAPTSHRRAASGERSRRRNTLNQRHHSHWPPRPRSCDISTTSQCRRSRPHWRPRSSLSLYHHPLDWQARTSPNLGQLFRRLDHDC